MNLNFVDYIVIWQHVLKASTVLIVLDPRIFLLFVASNLLVVIHSNLRVQN